MNSFFEIDFFSELTQKVPHSVYTTLKRQKMPGFCLFLLLHNDEAEFSIKNQNTAIFT